MSFSDPGEAGTYAERVARQVPGLHDLHRMTALLLAERAPANARILVLGAGGGLELKAMAEMQPGWRFDGVDPSAPMLAQARLTLGDLAERVTLLEGYIGDAPAEPYDGATCLLTLHFLDKNQRRTTLRQIGRRLRPGAPLVVAHHSISTAEPAMSRWLERSLSFARANGMPTSRAQFVQMMKDHLPILSPEEDASLMEEAGLSPVELFYAAFSFKGWVGYKPLPER